MAKKPTPARRLTTKDMSPKATMPAKTKGLVLKGKKQVLVRPELDAKGLPILPHPKGLLPSPSRKLTEKQMEKEQRERGGVATELSRKKNR